MNVSFSNILFVVVFCSCLLVLLVVLVSSEKLEIFGFGWVVVGFIDDFDVFFEGYENELLFKE